MANATISNGEAGNKYRRVDASDAWADIIAGAYLDGDSELDQEDSHTVRIWAHPTSDWKELSRAPISFDLTPLSGKTITYAIVRTKAYSKRDNLSITPNLALYNRTGANFEDFGSVLQSDTVKAYSDITVDVQFGFVLNAAGLIAANAAAGGVWLLGIRNAEYDVGTSEPDWTTGDIDSEIVLYNLNTEIFILYESEPDVATYDAEDVKNTTATLWGDLLDRGELTTNVRFEYGETDEYGTETAWQNDVSEGTFYAAIASLSPRTTYHFRSIATNSEGTVYGDDYTFTTKGAGSHLIGIFG